MQFLVIGSTSNLSRAIQSHCLKSNLGIKVIETSSVKRWSDEPGDTGIEECLQLNFDESKTLAVIYASGITNHQIAERTMLNYNYIFPLRIAQFFAESSVKVFFPGAYMENFPRYCQTSPYLQSKLMLAQNLEKVSGNWTNLRFSQWYGTSKLRTHLFLGSALESIRRGMPFFMSNGMQLREYHHIDDDVKVFFHEAFFPTGHLDVLHGQSLRIRDLMTALFTHFNSEHLLNFGTLVSDELDNYTEYSRPNPLFSDLDFRETYSGFLGYAKSILDNTHREN